MLPELPQAGAAVDEWLFAGWSVDARVGWISGHRLLGRRAWYWSALVRDDGPLLHLTEWDVPVRSDVFVVKAPEMWAEHHCVGPFEQWSVGNEAYFVALDDPDEALGPAYGRPTPTAMDLEWYAAASPEPADHGFRQNGWCTAGSTCRAWSRSNWPRHPACGGGVRHRTPGSGRS